MDVTLLIKRQSFCFYAENSILFSKKPKTKSTTEKRGEEDEEKNVTCAAGRSVAFPERIGRMHKHEWLRGVNGKYGDGGEFRGGKSGS